MIVIFNYPHFSKNNVYSLSELNRILLHWLSLIQHHTLFP